MRFSNKQILGKYTSRSDYATRCPRDFKESVASSTSHHTEVIVDHVLRNEIVGICWCAYPMALCFICFDEQHSFRVHDTNRNIIMATSDLTLFQGHY